VISGCKIYGEYILFFVTEEFFYAIHSYSFKGFINKVIPRNL